ncbi:MAG: PD-(D/E)XK nuclease family transposase [Bacteroidales bacterium]|nr:PD-(D/E)XK nuclease family transposase [Bacteroidales bacterium]
MPSTHIRFDWAIKRLLRQKANFGILEGFLSELLKQDVLIKEILESESNQETEQEKFNRVDILASLDGGELVIIEVQNEREHDYFHRMNFSQAKLITQYLKVGNRYKNVKRIISVNIVYFELGQGQDYIYEGHTDFIGIHSKDKLSLSGSQRKLFPDLNAVSEIFAQYFIIKVNVFDDIAKDTLDEWVYFLKNSEIKDSFKAKGLKEAKEKMRQDNLEGIEKVAYEQFVKEQRIKEAEIESVLIDAQIKHTEQLQKALAEAEKERAEKESALKKEAEALAKAEKERAEKEKERAEKESALSKIVKIVKNLSASGMTQEAIAKMLSLTIEEVENCLNR